MIEEIPSQAWNDDFFVQCDGDFFEKFLPSPQMYSHCVKSGKVAVKSRQRSHYTPNYARLVRFIGFKQLYAGRLYYKEKKCIISSVEYFHGLVKSDRLGYTLNRIFQKRESSTCFLAI